MPRPEWPAVEGAVSESEVLARLEQMADGAEPATPVAGEAEEVATRTTAGGAEGLPALDLVSAGLAADHVAPGAAMEMEDTAPAWLEEGELPSGDEALAWLEQLAEGKEAELQAQAEAEGEARVAEIMGRPIPREITAEETAPEPAEPEEAFGWTEFGLGEPLPPAAEPTLTQELSGEIEAAGASELLEPPEAEKEEAGLAAGDSPVPTVPRPEGAPDAAAEPSALDEAVLRDESDDAALLASARRAWQAGQRDQALEAYQRVVRSDRSLETAIEDLEGYVAEQADVETQRLLGDAYMRAGRLQDALSAYRQALDNL